jgi:uncharacterized protein YoxC
MNIKESVSEINELSNKLAKCEEDLKKIEKEIEELLSIHKKKILHKKKKNKNKKHRE